MPTSRATLRVLHAAADGVERYLMALLSGDYSELVWLVLGSKIKLVAVTRIEQLPLPVRL